MNMQPAQSWENTRGPASYHGNKMGMSPVVCYNCQQPGHIARNCMKYPGPPVYQAQATNAFNNNTRQRTAERNPNAGQRNFYMRAPMYGNQQIYPIQQAVMSPSEAASGLNAANNVTARQVSSRKEEGEDYSTQASCLNSVGLEQ